MMKLAYEIFLVDTGLGGDVFCRDYKKLHILVEESWFQQAPASLDDCAGVGRQPTVDGRQPRRGPNRKEL